MVSKVKNFELKSYRSCISSVFANKPISVCLGISVHSVVGSTYKSLKSKNLLPVEQPGNDQLGRILNVPPKKHILASYSQDNPLGSMYAISDNLNNPEV